MQYIQNISKKIIIDTVFPCYYYVFHFSLYIFKNQKQSFKPFKTISLHNKFLLYSQKFAIFSCKEYPFADIMYFVLKNKGRKS